MNARVVYAAANGKGPDALATISTLFREPRGTFLQDVAYPVQRLEVMLKRGPAEQSDFGDVGGTSSRHASFTFYRFDHGGFFPTHVRTGASA